MLRAWLDTAEQTAHLHLWPESKCDADSHAVAFARDPANLGLGGDVTALQFADAFRDS